MTQILRQSTQIKVVIGPVVAVGDGFTPVTTLDLSTADEAEIIKSDAAAVTSISAATFAAIANADGYYNLTLTTSLTDTCGLLTVLINDDSLCLPVKATFMVVEEAIYDALYAASANGFAGSAGSSTVTFANTSIATVTNLTNLPSITAGWLTATGIASDAFTAAKFAADFGTEMRTVLHGGDYAADMDANGRIRIVDGTGAGELDTLSGTVLLRAANEAVLADLVDGGRLDLLIDAIKAKTDSLTFTVAGQVDANAVAISGDATAADRFETMLDGTGGQTLSLGQLRIDSSAAGGAVDIDNSAGPGIKVNASISQNAIDAVGGAGGIGIRGSASSGYGIVGDGGLIGIWGYGTYTGLQLSTTTSGQPAAILTSSNGDGLAPGVIGIGFASTADSGTTTTLVDAARTEADTDYWKGSLIRFTSGTIAGQVRLITGFTPGTDTITFAPAVTQSVGTNTYEIIPAGRVDLHSILGTLSPATAGYVAPDWAQIGNPTTTVNLSGTTVKTATDIATQIAALNNITAASVVTAMGTGTFLTAIPWNSSWDAEVESEATDALTSYGASTLTAAGVRTAVGLAAANLDTQLADIPTNSELATAIITGLTAALTEGYRSTGATGSVRDLLYEIIAHMGESSISGTTKTLKKLDGSTTAKTYTLDSASTPTSITETT